MRHLLFVLSTILLLSSTSTVQAQETKKNPPKVDFRGRLISSSDGELLVGAYVYIGKDKDTPVAVTDSLGAFKVSCLKDSLLSLSFSYMGFQPLTRKYYPRSTYNAGAIKMTPDVLSIDEVVVTARPPLTVQNGDTTEFNANALKMAVDADLENLLKKLPGFEIINGKIMAQGQEVKKIYIDGKKYFLNNPQEALKNLPASLVSKVKMFDDSSEEAKFSGYDDGAKQRSLNIVTKNPNAMKMFGNVKGGYGISEKIEDTFNDNKYDMSLSANLFDRKRRISISGDIGSNDQANTLEQAKYKGEGGKNGNKQLSLNYSTDIKEKVQITANYNFGASDSYNASASIQDYFPSENYESRIYNSENHSWGKSGRHNLNLDVEYKISKKDKITFTPNFSYSETDNRSIVMSNTVENGDTINSSLSNNKNKNNSFNVGGKLSWMHAFKKQGRTLTTSLNFGQNKNDGTQLQNVDERFRNIDNILSDTIRNKRNITNTDNYDYTLSASYSEPLSKKSRLSVNYSFQKSSDENSKESISFKDRDFHDIIGIDTALTNDVGVIKLRNRVGLNYNYREKDKFTIRGGANISSTKMDNEYSFLGVQDSVMNSNYIDIAPRAEFDYKLSKTKNLNVSYNGSTSSPNASQLQDILDVSNPLQVSKGNPDLRKTFQHSLSMRYSSSNTEKNTYTNLSLSANQTFNNVATNMQFIQRDTIVNGYELQRGTRLSSPINLNGGWNMSADFTYSFPIKPLKVNINSGLNYRYSHSPSIYDNTKTFNNAHSAGLNLSVVTNISENFDVFINSNTSYQYSTNTQTGVSELLTENVNANLRWIFWKGFLVGGNMRYNYSINQRGTAVKQSSAMLDVELGKKFGKMKQFELKFNASDILRQRNLEMFSLTDHYASTNYSTNTDTYYTLSFSYRLMRMGKGMDGAERGKRGMGRGMGGGMVRSTGGGHRMNGGAIML